MHGYGSHLSVTRYDIITSKWNCVILVLNEMHGIGNKMHLGKNEYSLEVFEAA